MLGLLLLLVQISSAVEAKGCSATEIGRLDEVQQLLGRGDLAAARNLIQSTDGGSSTCASLELARLAIGGWFDAREAARAGGSPESLAPLRALVEKIGLESFARFRSAQAAITSETAGKDQVTGVLDLQIEYAQTTIRAAMAAAQDERPEMELWLDHAGDLVQRLMLRGARATWPRTYNLVVGELWFEVDRYDEARAAYARAVQADPSAVALVGLARTEARQGQIEQACATFKRARDVSPALRATAARDLARCF